MVALWRQGRERRVREGICALVPRQGEWVASAYATRFVSRLMGISYGAHTVGTHDFKAWTVTEEKK